MSTGVTSEGWEVSYVGLIAFTTETQIGTPQAWWRTTVGDDSSESTKKKHVLEEKGRCDNGILTLTIDLLRVLWTLSPFVEPDTIPERVPSVGAFPEVIRLFQARMEAWLPSCPPITRLALNAKLLRYGRSRADCYAILAEYLKGYARVDPESTDFLYRVNRRRQLDFNGYTLAVNRLSTWGAVKTGIVAAPNVPGASPMTLIPLPESNAVSLELDINTDHEVQEQLPPRMLGGVLEQLVRLGVEIAETGDVR